MNIRSNTASLVLCIVCWLLAAPAAMAADQVKRYELERGDKGYQLALRVVARPTPAAHEVLVRIRAVSLNHRDLYVLKGNGPAGLVPLSDGAGEVIAVGEGITRLKAGDRVATTFFEKWNAGAPTGEGIATARGGDTAGVLSQMIATHEDGLVKIPDHLSFEEAATLPCAGVTAWNGLFKHGNLQRRQFVLLEGTGGVSIFGLQFAAAAGAKPIITSSSDAKLERAKSLGAVATVNYQLSHLARVAEGSACRDARHRRWGAAISVLKHLTNCVSDRFQRVLRDLVSGEQHSDSFFLSPNAEQRGSVGIGDNFVVRPRSNLPSLNGG